MSFYGIYKQVRDASWNCLIDFKIKKLPVDVLQIARNAQIKVIKNKEVNELALNEFGVSIFDGKVWYIIYDDTMSIPDIRYIIGHELGHIFIGHELRKVDNKQTFKSDKYDNEKEADDFSSRLLAPACALWGLKLKTPEEISTLCNIPYNISRQRANRLVQLYKRNKFLTSPLEEEVYRNFYPWINEEINV